MFKKKHAAFHPFQPHQKKAKYFSLQQDKWSLVIYFPLCYMMLWAMIGTLSYANINCSFTCTYVSAINAHIVSHIYTGS